MSKKYPERIVLTELGEYFAPTATKPTPIKPVKQRRKRKSK